MEERIIDDPRKIKVKRNSEGGIEDATDALAPDDGEEEVVLDFTEEYDEDLVGLSPSQLQEELERRKKAEEEARAESKKLLEEAEQALASGEYAAAEPLFGQALVYDPENIRAQEGVWICRTRNYKKLEAFYETEKAEEFAQMNGEAKRRVLSRVRSELEAQREAYAREAAPIEERFGAAQKQRREAFGENRKYYLLRLSILAFFAAAFIVASGVSAYFIVRSNTIVPVVLAAAFGGVALVFLCFTVFFLRKFIVADRLCRENERLSSTEEGARLSFLRDRLNCLALILDEEETGSHP